MLVGMILGPLSTQLRRALISQGDPTVFLTRPIATSLLAIAAVISSDPRWSARPPAMRVALLGAGRIGALRPHLTGTRESRAAGRRRRRRPAAVAREAGARAVGL
jgi:hypothetical protein